MVNWAELPDELIEVIAKQMNCVGDYVRFGGVCQSWRSVAAFSVPTFCPWLILPEKEPPKEKEDSFEEEEYVVKTFFDLSLGEQYIEVPKWLFEEEQVLLRKFFDISSKEVIAFKLPEANARRCMGSPHGWLLTIGLDLNIHLLNPLTRRQIPLPSQRNLEGHDYYRYYRNEDPTHIRLLYIRKFALSSHPTHPCCVVMVIHSRYRDRLAYITPGDKSWTPVKTSYKCYEDIIFFNNLFYLVDSGGNIDLYDISKPDPEVELFMSPPPFKKFLLERRSLVDYTRFYLVDVFGDFCFVLRILEDDLNTNRVFTTEFQVYKLDFSTNSWMELRSLHNYALFLGTNISFAVSTSDKPQLKSNSIYFTDDCVDSGRDVGYDMGLFDLEENKVGDPFYGGDDILSMFSPPLYFTPSLIFG